MSTSTSGASTNVRACTRTLVNGLVPPPRHDRLGVAAPRRRRCARPGPCRSSGRARCVGSAPTVETAVIVPTSKWAPSQSPVGASPRGGGRGGVRRPAAESPWAAPPCRRRAARVAGTLDVGRRRHRAAVDRQRLQGVVVAAAGARAEGDDGGDEQEAAVRQDDAVHDRATRARARRAPPPAARTRRPSQPAHRGPSPRTRGGSSSWTPASGGTLTGLPGCRPRSSRGIASRSSRMS